MATAQTQPVDKNPLVHLDEHQLRRLKIERPDLFPTERRKPLKVIARPESPSIEARGIHDDKVGELAPGDSGWLPLDAEGKPSGPATLLPPYLPVRACRVYANPPGSADLLVTNSGAPITDAMQAQTDYHQFGIPPVEPQMAATQGGAKAPEHKK